MVAGKKRLYVALYPSGVTDNEERNYVHTMYPCSKHKLILHDRYRWGFVIGPKVEKGQAPGRRLHVKNHPVEGWKYEEVPLQNIQSTTNLLARILIAKIESEESLVAMIRSTPVVRDDSNWRCRHWIAAVLEKIAKDGKAVGTAELDWSTIETTARRYVADKTAAGRY